MGGDPVVLDLDGSVGVLPAEHRIPLGDWQETLRFASSRRALRRFRGVLAAALPARHGPVLIGSGDFHHLSWLLIERVRSRAPFQVVVLDNHPDNMRYPFGVHCGSWVRCVARLPQVAHVHVVGIGSSDVAAGHAWENYLGPLLRRSLTYWCVGVDVGWARRLGLGDAFRSFAQPQALVTAFCEQQRRHPLPTYVSIDKDVFARDVVRTNWDQGQLRLRDAEALIESVGRDRVGSDVTGEVSMYRYRSWWKRRLSALDGQPAVSALELAAWQSQQHALNLQLLALLGTSDV